MRNKMFKSVVLSCFLVSLAFADLPESIDSSKIAYPQLPQPQLPQPQLPQPQLPQLVHSVSHIEGLNVTPHNRNIQIVSEESVILYFFDRQIDLVFAKKIPAGFNFVSLENQKQGIYYAVLQVGELMQVVRVVVI